MSNNGLWPLDNFLNKIDSAACVTLSGVVFLPNLFFFKVNRLSLAEGMWQCQQSIFSSSVSKSSSCCQCPFHFYKLYLVLFLCTSDCDR